MTMKKKNHTLKPTSPSNKKSLRKLLGEVFQKKFMETSMPKPKLNFDASLKTKRVKNLF